MITAAEKKFIGTHAHVPEHLPGYVQAISQAEPHLLGHYLCFCGEDALIFNGYPLGSCFDETAMMEVVELAVSRFKPKQVALIAPTISKNPAAFQVVSRPCKSAILIPLGCEAAVPRGEGAVDLEARNLNPVTERSGE
jgi:hypothetical protein